MCIRDSLGLATLEQKEEKFRESLDILNKMIVETPEDATLYVARADVEREMKHEDLAPVSYTHLDVYKRQRGCSLVLCCRRPEV